MHTATLSPSPLDQPALDEPVRLPASVADLPRPPIPVLTAIVPVVGAVVLWQITGSPYALWFAVLGPLVAIATVLDGLRSSRRIKRRARRERTAAVSAASAEIERRHAGERRALWMRHPDVAAFATHPDEMWRAVPGRGEVLLIGRGEGRSGLRVEGGDQDAGTREVRAQAARLEGAPVTVPLTAGVAVVGPPVAAAAVARALVLQAALALPPGQLELTGVGEIWSEHLPHREARGGPRVWMSPASDAIPPQVDIPIVCVGEGAPPPPRCAAVLTLSRPGRARLDYDGSTREVEVESVSAEQAAVLAAVLAERAVATLGTTRDDAVELGSLLPSAPRASATALAAPIGIAGGEAVILDLVADGPHAVVIGVTGSGKSELLTSWIVALCAEHRPTEVSFLLVDFKGGRTFDALAALPHVTGVMTDLDEPAALRAVESLRAEIRHRERILARHGARQIAEAAQHLSRLVIVVDEYAALVAAHPGLHELFGDIAARGRALGMHLILASQRAAGVFRDAVLANAPLRISLRVTDAADSRAVLGVPDAAALSGRAGDVGIALVRRAADDTPRAVRIAACGSETITMLAERYADSRARRPWLAPLPEVIELDELRVEGKTVIGLIDEPERQSQRAGVLPADAPGLVVVGSAGSGRSTALQCIAAQTDAGLCRWIPAEPEAAWDDVAGLAEVAAGTVVLIDDVDALLARFPPDHAGAILARLEQMVREARSRGIRFILSAQRVTSPVARLAELIPSRLILATATRADHAAAGGEVAHFVRAAPPGRGRLDGALIQVAHLELPSVQSIAPPPAWHPTGAVAFVAPASEYTRLLLRAWATEGVRVAFLDEAGEPPAAGTLVWGTPESWLAHWRALTTARADARLVIDTACAMEYRALTGSRDLPPFAAAGARRAWLHDPDGHVTRVALGP